MHVNEIQDRDTVSEKMDKVMQIKMHTASSRSELPVPARRAGVREQISWTLSHGNNNIVLGLTLALLYLTPDDVVRFVAWDIAWIMGLSAIQPVLRRVSPLPAGG